MVYVIFLCIALPLGLMLPILERRSRRLVFFLLLGMTMALVAYEVDTILYSPFWRTPPSWSRTWHR